MYAELGAIKEVVDLPPRDALDEAQALFTRLGYVVALRRTDTSLTVTRKRTDGRPERGVPNLTVVVLPQEGGGVRVKVRGNDREGMQERRAEWEKWAKSLPKKGTAAPGDTVVPLREPVHSAPFVWGGEAPIAAQKTDEVPASVPGEHEVPAEAQSRKSAPGPYEYRMVPVPPAFAARGGDEGGEEAARWLESLANRQAERGWEFYRVDALASADRPRRLGAALSRSERAGGHVASFRRPRQVERALPARGGA